MVVEVLFQEVCNLFGDKESRKEARANNEGRPQSQEGAMSPMRAGGMPMGGPGMGFVGGFGGGLGYM